MSSTWLIFHFFISVILFDFLFFHVFAYEMGNRKWQFDFLGVVLCLTTLIGDRIHDLKNNLCFDSLSPSNGDNNINGR